MNNKTYRVLFLPERKEIYLDTGTNIMDAFHIANVAIDAPCGGNGTCGKCLVKVITEDGTVDEVLACKTFIRENMTIDISHKSSDYHILQGGSMNKTDLKPMIKRVQVFVEKAQLGDHRSEWERLCEAISTVCNIPTQELTTSTHVLSTLYNDFIRFNRNVDVILFDREVLCVCPVGSPLYAVAFDIGTTTIVGYLLNLDTGEQVAVSSVLNPQSAYGADVIVRSKYSIEHGVSPLTNAVRDSVNTIIDTLSTNASINMHEIFLIAIAGNTCMHHLFLGISPASLVYAPYNPAIRSGLVLNASALGIKSNANAKLIALPNIASFLGADTVSAVLASEMYRTEKLTLLIDFGTNGEIVLGNRDGMIACSTAAGPAFEGALIECGMRGAEGAIDHVSLAGGKVDYSVIGQRKPVGICGSGLLDIIGELIRVGLIDDTGKLHDECSSETSKELCQRVREINGKKAFVIAEATECANGSPVYVTQKDIREVQLAKGAIAAGIMLLVEETAVTVDTIEQVLIAGAFGNYMSPESACQLSMIPPTLRNRIIPIGNAAGEGAKRVLLNSDEYQWAQQISSLCKYLELAAHPDFQDVFIDCLSFPEAISNN